MKIYLQLHSIPELQGLNFQQKMQVMHQAAQKLTVPQKVLLNTLKLVLLTLAFVWIFYLDSVWMIALSIIATGIFYPLLIKPLQLLFCRPYFEKARKVLEL